MHRHVRRDVREPGLASEADALDSSSAPVQSPRAWRIARRSRPTAPPARSSGERGGRSQWAQDPGPAPLRAMPPPRRVRDRRAARARSRAPHRVPRRNARSAPQPSRPAAARPRPAGVGTARAAPRVSRREGVPPRRRHLHSRSPAARGATRLGLVRTATPLVGRCCRLVERGSEHGVRAAARASRLVHRVAHRLIVGVPDPWYFCSVSPTVPSTTGCHSAGRPRSRRAAIFTAPSSAVTIRPPRGSGSARRPTATSSRASCPCACAAARLIHTAASSDHAAPRPRHTATPTRVRSGLPDPRQAPRDALARLGARARRQWPEAAPDRRPSGR